MSELREQQAELERQYKVACDTLAAIPGVGESAMGLTPDAVRLSPEYRDAKYEMDCAFRALRRWNAAYAHLIPSTHPRHQVKFPSRRAQRAAVKMVQQHGQDEAERLAYGSKGSEQYRNDLLTALREMRPAPSSSDEFWRESQGIGMATTFLKKG